MGFEESSCQGFVKQEESSWARFITYKRRKRGSPDADSVHLLDTPPERTRDIGWDHGEIIDGNELHWRCKWCGLSKYSGGVSKLKRHIAGSYPVKKCPNVPEDIAKLMLNHLLEKQNLIPMRLTRQSAAKKTELDSLHNNDFANNGCLENNLEMNLASPDRHIKCNSPRISAQRCPSTKQSKIASQLHAISETKDVEDLDKMVSHSSNRIISHWKNIVEQQFRLPYIKPGHGMWNVFNDALALNHSQLSEKWMVDLVEDNKQLKDRSSVGSEMKIQQQNSICAMTDKGQETAQSKDTLYESIASYCGEDTNTQKCERALLDILISEKFALLCDFIREFEEGEAKNCLDFSFIDTKLKNGDYEQAPEFLNQDIQQIWEKFQKMAQKMLIISSNLSSISTEKQVANQLDGGRKHSLSADPTVQSKYSRSDCSIKPHETEAADLYKVCTCKQCGTEANGQRSLICDGCEAMYHFSCIKPVLSEIPIQCWYCNACTSNGKDSPDPASSDSKKDSLHKNCAVCDRLEVSETQEDADEHGSGAIPVTDCGESSISNLNSEEPPELSRTVKSSLCKVCGECEEEDRKFLICGHIQCPFKFYHVRCLKTSQIASAQQLNKQCWYCPSCLCRACLCDQDDEKIVLCDGCDEAYHTYCMKPPRTMVPKGEWYCVPCSIARAKEGMKRYEQWILQQHRKIEGGQSDEANGSVDVLPSVTEKLSSGKKGTIKRTAK
ncbi:PHD finger protein EHD3-like [Zingiber officinale]|uniref:Uncharacterized protein n=1 Tax=Zingiber officinale TaxID=94328 RepID=A0A8J5GXL7_ZINOF|nr:PHD finger protein EHD3-like [Zingiber officinale]KAG6511951.1 hypothetical protein ZIOFF_030030 [Zingiber officinale]